jgi:hypothetical protein
MKNRKAREKIAIDPLVLIGSMFTLAAMIASATWFIIQRIENAEILLLKNQISMLEEQIKLRGQEIQEKTDVLQRVSTIVENNKELSSLVKGIIKEPVGIVSSREIWINEAIIIPETNITIAYENYFRSPYLKETFDSIKILIKIPIIRRFFTTPNLISIRDYNKEFNRLMTIPGAEIQFKYNTENYRLFTLAVREKSIRISVYKDIPKS